MVEFMTMSLTGRSSTTNFILMSTAKWMILTRLKTCFGKAIDQFGVGVEETFKVAVSPFVTTDGLLPKLKPGISPRFLSQNMVQRARKR